MHFPQVFAFVAIIVAAVSATPALFPRACDPAGCVAALGGEFAACAVAASMGGLDPFADAACFAAAAGAIDHVSECTDCF